MEEKKCCDKTMRLVGGTGGNIERCFLQKDGTIKKTGVEEIMIYQCEECKRILMD